MTKRLIQWILSKVFPYNGFETLSSNEVYVDNWEKTKMFESEQFYGGQDGTGGRDQWNG
jgi:hypothetical protein